MRTNGNGFDLNRDYITQSQPEAQASVDLIKSLPFAQVLDLHGYVAPTLLEATTVPHNPGIEYDIWLKWNQPRLDANQAALASEGFGVSRPDQQHPHRRVDPRGRDAAPGLGRLAPSTPASTASCAAWTRRRSRCATGIRSEPDDFNLCGIDGVAPSVVGRAGALRSQELATLSSVAFAIENRREMMYDQFEIYRRGVDDAPRVRLTSIPPAVIGTPADHDYMTDYPRAHVIPVGSGQRSDAEAKRLVDFLLDNDIEVSRLRRDYRFGGQVFDEGSYVVRTSQALRALANTMLDVGDDISDRVTELYAPPGSWSNGFLWGADVVTIGRGRPFTPATRPIEETDEVEGGVRPGNSDWYALEVDSRTAVTTVNELVADGRHGPAGHRAVRDQAGRHARRQRPVPANAQGSAPRRRARGRAVVRACPGPPARP